MYFRYFAIIWKRAGPSFVQIWVLITQECFVQSLVGSVVLEKKLLKICQCIFASPKDALFRVWLKLARGSSGEEIFSISSMYVRDFKIISPWKRSGPFIWTNLNPLYPRMLCAKFASNWPSRSREQVQNVKSVRHRQQLRTTDKFCEEKAHLSLPLRWAIKK